MILDPLSLPLRPSEANELANLVFELAERRPLTQEIRTRIASRAAVLKLETLHPHLGSLVRDPVHHSTYYVAVDVSHGPPLLLHMALSTAPTSSIFQKPLLIGRMRRAAGQEIVINAVPFSPADSGLLAKFTADVDEALAPKVQGTRAGIVAAPVPAAFDAFRSILKRTGRNLAAIEMTGAEFDTGLYHAVRAGWREGYSAGVAIAADSADRQTIQSLARFTRFRLETSALSHEGVDEGDRFRGALLACEQAHEWIRQARATTRAGRAFDFDAALPVASAVELQFCLDWLKRRGHPPQLVSPGPIAAEGFEAEVGQMAAVARQFSCQLSFDTGSNGSRLESIARAAAGRVNFRVTRPPSDDAEYSQYLTGLADILLA